MFRDYSEFFNDPGKQHNIMVLVGNGFDVAAVKRYGEGQLKGTLPKYSAFYDYVTSHAGPEVLKYNRIYKEMTKDREEGHNENWSDFELIVDRLITEINSNKRRRDTELGILKRNLEVIRDWFSRFLRELIPTETMIAINNDSMKKELALQSFSKFLGDLDIPDLVDLRFERSTSYFDIFSFLLVNFNYTMLLDNYLFLDSEQFDPVKFKSPNVDRNFTFYPAPTIEPRTLPGEHNCDISWSSYLVTEMVHPHGFMDIPRSIIFGTELDKYEKHGKETEKLFVKSYWARDEIKYSKYFEGAELFIIYGMSITKTDAWWFDHIYERLLDDEPELIIYAHYSGDVAGRTRQGFKEEIKDRFIRSCIRNGKDRNKNDAVKEKIKVVVMEDNDTYFLGFEKKTGTT